MRLTGRAPGELADAKDWDEARRIIAYHRAEARVREANEDLATEKLSRYAGVPGTDWEGHPLDRREFAATKSALDMLETFRRAQYANGQYRADLMDAVSNMLTSNKLPDPGHLRQARK